MKKRNAMLWILFLVATFCSCSFVRNAGVSQGKCIAFDKDKKIISIEEYNTEFSNEYPYGKPTGVVSVYNVSRALIGIPPEPGDILRIAYEVKGEEKLAHKVMNVSKQDLRKK